MQTQESKVDVGKALNSDLVDTKSIMTDSTMQDECSRLGNDTNADDTDIIPIYDEEPMAKVQLTAECNIFAIGQQHTEPPEIIHEVAKIPVLDTGNFEQWQFWIQQYLQHEHYALWEVIEFDDSNKVPATTDPNNTTTTSNDAEKSERTVTITTQYMQRKKNDVKARTTLPLSLPDEHQLRNDLDTMSLDDLYNHLKVYEAEVQKKSNPNSQNIAFISSSKHSSGDEDGNTAYVSTASTTVPTASASVATISQDTASAYIASQSSG
nr:hypothetical protein [Tanacetum cinerariifolium]